MVILCLMNARTLREYSEFVARLRRCAKQGPSIEEAVERAVTECIEEGILSDFLRSQRAEVIAVSIFEYNEEEELKKTETGRIPKRNGRRNRPGNRAGAHPRKSRRKSRRKSGVCASVA